LLTTKPRMLLDAERVFPETPLPTLPTLPLPPRAVVQSRRFSSSPDPTDSLVGVSAPIHIIA